MMNGQRKMTHRRAQVLLADYTANELIATERRLLEEHLKQCNICQKDLAEIHYIRAQLRSFALPATFTLNDAASTPASEAVYSLPDQFAQESVQVMLEERHSKISVPRRGSRQRTGKVLLTLLAASLSLLVVFSTVLVFNLETHMSSTGAQPVPKATPKAIVTPKAQCPTPTPTLTLPTMNAVATPTRVAGIVQPTPTPATCIMPATLSTPTP